MTLERLHTCTKAYMVVKNNKTIYINGENVFTVDEFDGIKENNTIHINGETIFTIDRYGGIILI